MADITNEVLIAELLKIDARAERVVVSMEETVAYLKETNRLVAQWRQEGMDLKAALARRNIKQTGITE